MPVVGVLVIGLAATEFIVDAAFEFGWKGALAGAAVLAVLIWLVVLRARSQHARLEREAADVRQQALLGQDIVEGPHEPLDQWATPAMKPVMVVLLVLAGVLMNGPLALAAITGRRIADEAGLPPWLLVPLVAGLALAAAAAVVAAMHGPRKGRVTYHRRTQTVQVAAADHRRAVPFLLAGLLLLLLMAALQFAGVGQRVAKAAGTGAAVALVLGLFLLGMVLVVLGSLIARRQIRLGEALESRPRREAGAAVAGTLVASLVVAAAFSGVAMALTDADFFEEPPVDSTGWVTSSHWRILDAGTMPSSHDADLLAGRSQWTSGDLPVARNATHLNASLAYNAPPMLASSDVEATIEFSRNGTWHVEHQGPWARTEALRLDASGAEAWRVTLAFSVQNGREITVSYEVAQAYALRCETRDGVATGACLER